MEDSFNRVFIHGLESSGRGTKGTYFRELYPRMIIEDYYGTLDERMEKLRAILYGRDNLLIVGSSYGGLMASIFACTNEAAVRKLILLAPALALKEFEGYRNSRIHVPTTVYHGNKDDVVPVEPVRKIASEVFLNLSYNIIDDNHPLERQFKLLDWMRLLCYENGQ